MANSIRVIKTKKQTSSENCSYISAAQEIIEKDLVEWISRWNRANVKNTFTTSVFFMSISKCFDDPKKGQMVEWVFGSSEKDSRKLAGQTKIISAKLLLAPHCAAGWCCRHLLSWTEHTSLLVQIQGQFPNLRPRSCGYLRLFTSEVGGSTKFPKRHQTHVWKLVGGILNIFFFHCCLSFDLIWYLVATLSLFEHKTTEPMMWHWLRVEHLAVAMFNSSTLKLKTLSQSDIFQPSLRAMLLFCISNCFSYEKTLGNPYVFTTKIYCNCIYCFCCSEDSNIEVFTNILQSAFFTVLWKYLSSR